jgi:hypothetical protein
MDTSEQSRTLRSLQMLTGPLMVELADVLVRHGLEGLAVTALEPANPDSGKGTGGCYVYSNGSWTWVADLNEWHEREKLRHMPGPHDDFL